MAPKIQNSGPMVRVLGPEGCRSKVPRDALNNARMATFDRLPNTPEAKGWVQAIFDQTLTYEGGHAPRKRQRKRNDQISFFQACGAFAHDLIRAHDNHDALGFCFRALDRVALSDTLISGTNFEFLISHWSNIGWLENTPFIQAKETWEGSELSSGYFRSRRYRATNEFIDLAAQHQITPENIAGHFALDLDSANLIQIRQESKRSGGQKVKPKQLKGSGPKFDACRHQVERLNQYMQQYTYNLTAAPAVRRVFNCGNRPDFDYDLGGRLYCLSDDNWMSKPKSERSQIRIEGQQTVEIDVRASQISVFYAICGQKLDQTEDPYKIRRYPRDVVKKIIVAMLGQGDAPSKWPRKFREEYAEKYGHPPSKDIKLKDLVSDIYQRHPVLRNLEKGQLDWAKLQYEESECLLNAMLSLHEQWSTPSLPVFDCLIVRKNDIGRAKDALSDAFHDRLGFTPIFSVSET